MKLLTSNPCNEFRLQCPYYAKSSLEGCNKGKLAQKESPQGELYKFAKMIGTKNFYKSETENKSVTSIVGEM